MDFEKQGNLHIYIEKAFFVGKHSGTTFRVFDCHIEISN